MTRSRNDSITANGWHDESASRFILRRTSPQFKADCELDDTSGGPLHFLQSCFPSPRRATLRTIATSRKETLIWLLREAEFTREELRTFLAGK